MSKLTLLSALSIATIGGVATGTYFLWPKDKPQLSKNDIKSKLNEYGYEALGHESDKWTAILASYKETVSVSSNSHLKFGDFDGNEGGESKLKEECNNALNSDSSNQSNYRKARKWCTNPRKLKDILNERFRFLNTTDGDDSTDQTHWDSKITEYNEPNRHQNRRFTGLPESSGGKIETGANGRKAIKAKCRDLENKNHYEKDFESDSEKAEIWCVTNK